MKIEADGRNTVTVERCVLPFVLSATSTISLMICAPAPVPRSHFAYRRVVAFGPRKDRSRDLILNLVMEKFDLSLRSTFSEGKQLRAVLQVNATARTAQLEVF
jgi:hypothetical protein